MTRGIRLHVWGDFAIFTRPEMKVERVSYDTITPSAARGIIESIFWKPEIRWVVTKLHVLNPIRFTSMRRNEVALKIPAGSVAKAMKSGRGALAQFVEEDRQQRASTLLRDVAYVIEATFEFVSGENNPGKYLDQFNRRARSGQCFQRPYFGTRECPADFALLEPGDSLPPSYYEHEAQRDLGWMLHDIEYQADDAGQIIAGDGSGRFRAEPRFFRATMVRGVIDVPALGAGEVSHVEHQ